MMEDDENTTTITTTSSSSSTTTTIGAVKFEKVATLLEWIKAYRKKALRKTSKKAMARKYLDRFFAAHYPQFFTRERTGMFPLYRLLAPQVRREREKIPLAAETSSSFVLDFRRARCFVLTATSSSRFLFGMCETVGQRTRGVQFERRRSIGRHVYGAELRQTLGSEEQNKELEDELERIRFCGDLWERGGRVYRRREKNEEYKSNRRDDDRRSERNVG